MKHVYFLSYLMLIGLLPLGGFSQPAMPVSRIVFQRGTDNRANVPVQGSCPLATTRVEAKATAINGGQSVDWTSIAGASSGTYAGMLNLSAGWYQLEIRSLENTTQTGYWSIDRVGVGEVLIVAGQSNAAGTPEGPDAQDDRVSCVAAINLALREYELNFKFQHLSGEASVGPTNNKHFYGALGDKLVQRLNVPVLILGAAIQATSSEEWARSAQGDLYGADQQWWAGQEDLKPYKALGIALNHYARRTGLRGILWFQGESDKGKSGDAYFTNIQQVINKSRADMGHTIPWMISQTSWIDGGGDAAITDAQRRLVSSVAACYGGPNTDSYGNEYRTDGTHFGPSQRGLLASLWDQSLTSSFFQNAQPFLLNGVPATITTGLPAPARQYGGGHLYVSYIKSGPTQPGGETYSVQLLTESGAYLETLGSGTSNPLLVYLPDNANGTYRVQVVSSANGNVSVPSERFYAFQHGLGRGTGTGLTGTYYPNQDLSGTPAITRVDSPMDLTWVNPLGNGMPADNRDWSARWTGFIEAPRTGTYTIKALNDDGSRVWVNNQLLINDWQVHPWAMPQYGQIYMEAGKQYPVKIELYQAWFAASVKLLWIVPGQVQSQYVPTDRLYPNSVSPTPTPPPTGSLAMVAPLYNCATGAIT
ncbi:MAG TPA: PA14 domain-containing protein, partial [Spirosoma sp.]|nr:PA14 domain-containing protein [Spirosoma sp.]